MTARSRLILLAVGGLALFALLAAGYILVADPYLKRVKAAKDLELQVDTQKAELEGLQEKTKRLPALQKVSLPADPEVAKREYALALNKILRDSGATGFNVVYLDGPSNNHRGIPQVDPKFKPGKASKPADYLTYTQVVYKITVPKIDLGTTADILRRYYSLGLLHQISSLKLNQTAAAGLGDDPRPQKERADLSLEITTTAIVVNGAPARRSLLPAPVALGGLVGGGGMAALEFPATESRAVGRNLLPEAFEPLLAHLPGKPTPVREYNYLSAKDLFHGPLPEIPPPPAKEQEKPLPPKPDYSEHIWYTTRVTTSEGDEQSIQVTITDKINHEDYEITVAQAGEKVKVRIRNFRTVEQPREDAEGKPLLGPDRKPLVELVRKNERLDSLLIAKHTMRNRNDFTVYGVDTDGSLILGEKPSAAAPPTDDKAKPAAGKAAADPKAPAADPKVAVVGGPAAVPPKAEKEKFYRWEYGKSLKQIVELTPAEADKAIRRAQSRLLPDTVGTADPSAGPSPDAGK